MLVDVGAGSPRPLFNLLCIDFGRGHLAPTGNLVVLDLLIHYLSFINIGTIRPERSVIYIDYESQ